MNFIYFRWRISWGSTLKKWLETTDLHDPLHINMAFRKFVFVCFRKSDKTNILEKNFLDRHNIENMHVMEQLQQITFCLRQRPQKWTNFIFHILMLSHSKTEKKLVLAPIQSLCSDLHRRSSPQLQLSMMPQNTKFCRQNSFYNFNYQRFYFWLLKSQTTAEQSNQCDDRIYRRFSCRYHVSLNCSFPQISK